MDSSRMALSFMDLLDQLVGALAAIDTASGVQSSGAPLLRAIAARPGASTAQLASAVGLSSSGCVRALDRLEAAGLVMRYDAGDHRSSCADLTPAGLVKVEEMSVARMAAVCGVLAVAPEALRGSENTAWLPRTPPAVT